MHSDSKYANQNRVIKYCFANQADIVDITQSGLFAPFRVASYTQSKRLSFGLNTNPSYMWRVKYIVCKYNDLEHVSVHNKF